MKHTTRVILFTLAAPLGAQVPPVPPAPPAPPAARVPAILPMARGWAEASREAAMQAREQSLQQAARAREEALQQGARAREEALHAAQMARGEIWSGHFPFSGSGVHAPQGWAQQDPADTLWRVARDALNRGDYRRAAGLFKEIPQKHPNSTYAAGAMYYQALSLYYIGNTAELQEALTVLDARRSKYPASSRNREEADPGLAVRIAGVLSSRGQGGGELVKRALAEKGETCDREDNEIRSQALSALMQTDPDEALQLAKKILTKRDECSVQLRRNAVQIIGNRRDASATAALVAAAKNDPSPDVRTNATRYLASLPGDEPLAAIEDLLKTSDDERVQRAAVQAMAQHPSPRARTAIRALIERNDVTESLRGQALDSFDPNRATMDDAAWLRGIYPKVDNPRLRAKIASAIGRIGGEANDQWLLALARNENASSEERFAALRRVTQNMDIASLGKFYDGAPQRTLREEVLRELDRRKEPEAVDKLIDVAKNSTDPSLRQRAIQILSNKKDPRATKLLLELIDKP